MLVEIQTRIAANHSSVIPASGFAWVNQNRRTIVTAVATLLIAIIVVVGGVVFYNSRAAKAAEGFGDAMRVFETPLAANALQLPPGTKTFATESERAKVAYPKFAEVAAQFGWTPAGRNALYMAGVTAYQTGQTADAESKLKEAAGSTWDKDIAALAKLSLAQIYHQTNRDADAISIYNELTAKPTTTVPAGLAQLQLAALYESTGKADAAKKIYAQLKDKDAKGVAGTVASQKLTGAPAQ